MIEKYQLKNGETRYQFQIRKGSKVTRRRGLKTKAEAMRVYSEVLEKLEKEEANKNKVKYEEVYQDWLKIYETNVKPSTFHRNYKMFQSHVLPIFGGLYLEEITPKICQDFVSDLTDYTHGRRIFNQAKRVYDFAIKMGQADKNPFNNVITPKFKESKQIVNFLEIEEVQKLLDYIKPDLYWYAIFRLLIYTGIRRGELLALLWEDIDFENNELRINKSLSVGRDYKVFVSDTKTKKSNRVLDLDSETVLTLKKHRLSTKGDIVFPNSSDDYRRLSDIQDKLNKLTRYLGIKKIRVHDLRHTHASLLFASGANYKEVQDRLGHAKISTTMNIYTHITKDKREEVLDNFVRYIENI